MIANATDAIPTPRGLSPSVTRIARDHSKSVIGACACIALGVTTACGAARVPLPPAAQVLASDYIEVPFTPRPPPVEIVPARPSVAGDLVWADGGWEWSGDRYRWGAGGWVVVPPGAKRARWVVVRRAIDGQLFFAPSSWRDASGKAILAPNPLARANTGRGGPTGGDEVAPSSGPPQETPVLDE